MFTEQTYHRARAQKKIGDMLGKAHGDNAHFCMPGFRGDYLPSVQETANLILVNPAASHGAKVCALLDRLDGAPGVVPLPEADLRAVFVELQILASDDEDDARRRWGAVFALGLEEG